MMPFCESHNYTILKTDTYYINRCPGRFLMITLQPLQGTFNFTQTRAKSSVLNNSSRIKFPPRSRNSAWRWNPQRFQNGSTLQYRPLEFQKAAAKRILTAGRFGPIVEGALVGVQGSRDDFPIHRPIHGYFHLSLGAKFEKRRRAASVTSSSLTKIHRRGVWMFRTFVEYFCFVVFSFYLQETQARRRVAGRAVRKWNSWT